MIMKVLKRELRGWLLCSVLAIVAHRAMAQTEADIVSPAGYEFLQYLQSDGTAYIDTGVVLDETYGVEMSFQILEKSSAATGVFGSRVSAGENNITVAYDGAPNLFLDFGNYGTSRVTTSYADMLDTTIYIRNALAHRWVTTDWVKYQMKTTAVADSVRCPGSAWIFAIQNTTWPKAKIRLGSCRILQAGVVYRDYVPARRTGDGELGLYEMQTKSFLSNVAGAGGFVAGPASRYRVVEAVASTGTQYVDTGFTMQSGDTYTLTCRPHTSLGNGSFKGLFGARTSAVTNNISAGYNAQMLFADYNDNREIKSGDDSTLGYTRAAIRTNLLEKLITIDATAKRRNLYLNGSLYVKSDVEIDKAFTCPSNATLFALSGTSWDKAVVQLYDCRIWRTNVLMRAFVPVVSTWDGMGALYDTVEGKLYFRETDWNVVSQPCPLIPSQTNWFTVAANKDIDMTWGECGRITGFTLGEEWQQTCPKTFYDTNGQVVGVCAGWRFDRIDGTYEESTANTFKRTLSADDYYGILTWRIKVLKSCSHRSLITVSAGMEGCVTNLPVLVRISEANIALFKYDQCLPTGHDISFALDEMGVNVLPYEIDTWNASGESLVWVKVPQVAAGTRFYVFWGGKLMRNNPRAVWTNYAAVWHCNADLADATGLGHDATRVAGSGENADGLLGRYWQNGNLSAPSVSAALTSVSNFTASGWFRVTEGATRRLISSKTSPLGDGFDMAQTGWGQLWFRGMGEQHLAFDVGDMLYDTTWKHFVFALDAAKGFMYVNGAYKGKSTVGCVEYSDSRIGLGGFGGDTPDAAGTIQQGRFDECRIYNGVAPAEYLKAEYDTVARADFLTYGAAVECGRGRSGFMVIVR